MTLSGILYSVQMECLEWILGHGGSGLDRDNSGGTPIHDAAEQGQVRRVELEWGGCDMIFCTLSTVEV